MNLKDFLLDNYIYIIIVIVLIIITIIGFLADKKKNNNKKVENNTNSGYDANAGGQINYQPNNNSLGGISPIPTGPLNVGLNNQMAAPVPNNNIGVVPQPMNGMNLNNGNINEPNLGNIPQPVEPLNNVMPSEEPLYQPLAEQPNLINNIGAPQTPEPLAFNGPQQVSGIGNMNQPNVGNIIQPVEPLNNVMSNPQPMASIEPQPIVNNPSLTNATNQALGGFDTPSQPQPIASMNQSNMVPPLNNVNPVMGEPMAVNNQMSQQPVNPTPMPGPVENTIPNPITPPQPLNPTPVGFVYGAQPNNPNNNM